MTPVSASSHSIHRCRQVEVPGYGTLTAPAMKSIVMVWIDPMVATSDMQELSRGAGNRRPSRRLRLGLSSVILGGPGSSVLRHVGLRESARG